MIERSYHDQLLTSDEFATGQGGGCGGDGCRGDAVGRGEAADLLHLGGEQVDRAGQVGALRRRRRHQRRLLLHDLLGRRHRRLLLKQTTDT